jgi:lipopolysaccharide/colanic/teichoic acid biosynthesis glycosyltransferase
MGYTYVGSLTEIKDSVIRKNSMINVPKLWNVYLGDDFILGDMEKAIIAPRIESLFNLILSLFLFVVLSPAILLLFLLNIIKPSRKYFFSEERFGQNEVVDLKGNMKPRPFRFYGCRSRNRFISKVPGLINVIKGDMNLVGNEPLTGEDVASLKEEWETMRFGAPAGLFHLWEITGDKEMTWEEKIITDNYYAMTRSFWGDIKILLKSFLPAYRQ